ncbi:MAG: helicase C-terminal domain-containing protein [Thermomicrobiales bacterium]
MLVPYWIWQDRIDQVLTLLHKHRDDNEVQWGWNLINDLLPLCHCVITPDRLQIKPFFPPVDKIPSFSQSERCIYLTATLSNDGILVTQMNAKSDTISSPITPSAADDIGDRMILVPQQLQLSLSDEEIKAYLHRLSKIYNVVVIVPSNKRAEYWNDVADETLTAKNLEQGIERLKNRSHGFTIMVAKYDGVDLPNDSCRVLAIDGLPEAISPVDQLEKQALDGSPSQTSRQLQRIEQGMGRGIRSRDDYCVVLLLGRKLVERLHEVNAGGHFSAATERQFQLSNQVASQLSGTSLENIDIAVRQCLDRDNGWVSVSRNRVAGVKYGQGRISSSNIELRNAFNFASMNRWSEAIASQQSVVNATVGIERGWNKQLLASYTYAIDPVEAERLQRSAIVDNSHFLKPASGLVYVKIKEGLGDQASRSIHHIKNSYENSDHFMIKWRFLLQDFEFSEDASRVNDFEYSLSKIGSHLGFQTQRPEKEFGRGPDVLWAMDSQEFMIIEAKSGTIAEEISKHDLAQLLSSCEWFQHNYGTICKGIPIMIHNSSTPHFTAYGKSGTRVMTPQHANSFRRDLRNFGQSFSASWDDVTSKHVAGLLTASGLDQTNIVAKHTDPLRQHK